MKYEEIQKELKRELKPDRYEHTLRVVETAVCLADTHGYDEKKARYAALLHDCAKSVPDEEKIALCRENNIPVNRAEFADPALLHAKCGAILARKTYGIDDEEVLHAIAVHTTGAPAMNTLDEILFIADYIEPGRKRAKHLGGLREIADSDLDMATLQILEDTVSYLEGQTDQVTDPTTMKAYKYFKANAKGEGEPHG